MDSLVRNLGKDNLKYLSQEFNSNILDLVKKGKSDIILMIIWVVLKILEENFQAKKSFMVLWRVT